MTNHRTLRCLAATSLLALAACGSPSPTEGADPEANLGTTASALSADSYWSWGTPGNTGAPLNLGTDTGRTCFLQGVTGELRGEQLGGIPASASIYRSGGSWWLSTTAGNGSGAMGHAACIPVTTNQRFLGWAGNTGDGSFYKGNKNWIKSNATTHCFLTEVSATTGFSSPSSYVKLQKEHLYFATEDYDAWTISGSFVEEQDTTSGGHATAVCVDMLVSVGDYSWQSYNTTTGETTAITPQADTFCGVTMLNGNYGYSNFGWNDGARVFPQNNAWNVFSSSGRGITGTCHKSITLHF